ncbi:hypothetical protein [Liquorilactobacillus mali]|uniref:hypothetical protein n=1 Tax=Liquorilactobacillus mali TaxID=1618 RepID=UPI00030238DE|nr:hypothetical protein [Liquorilactobacillus mali]
MRKRARNHALLIQDKKILKSRFNITGNKWYLNCPENNYHGYKGYKDYSPQGKREGGK